MAKLTSLEDLRRLLPEEERRAAEGTAPKPRIGYDGRPQRLRITLDARRRGKTVTLVSGFQLPAREVEAIAQDLKKRCGAGGQALDDAVEIQGDHRAKVSERLRALGFEL